MLSFLCLGFGLRTPCKTNQIPGTRLTVLGARVSFNTCGDDPLLHSLCHEGARYIINTTTTKAQQTVRRTSVTLSAPSQQNAQNHVSNTQNP